MSKHSAASKASSSAFLLAVALLSVGLSLAPAPARAQGCTPPEPADGRVSGAWWSQYAAWCRANGGSTWQNSSGGGCTPGPNWKCGGSSSSAATGQDALNQAAYQLGSALGQALVTWMFGNNNPQARAEREAFLRDLEQKKREAARRHRLAEAQRIQGMQDRLYARLKLNGLEELHLKDIDDQAPGSGLKMKMRDDPPQGYGIQGLPGTYVGGPQGGASGDAPSGKTQTGSGESAGNSGGEGKGIPGLPGIYVGGPREERFSLGGAGATPANAAQGDALQAKAVIVGKDGQPDFQNMSPQQIAELREQVSALPADRLDRMITGTPEAKETGAAGANGNEAPALAFKPSPQAQLAAGTGASTPAGSNSPALAQLREQAQAASIPAAGTGSPEALSAGARSGFDTAAGSAGGNSAVPAPAAVYAGNSQNGTRGDEGPAPGVFHTKPPPSRMPVATKAVVTSAPPPSTGATTEMSSAASASGNAGPPAADLAEADVPLVMHPEDLKIPARGGQPIFASPQERLAELRREVAVLRQVLLKLQQAQLDPGERKEWEEIMNKASGDAVYQAGNLLVDTFNYFTLKRFRAGLKDVQENLQDAAVKVAGETDANRREQLGAAIRLMEKQKAELGAIVESMDEVTHNGDVFVESLKSYDWRQKDKGEKTPEHELEGLHLSLQMALDNKLVQKWAGVNGEFGDALKFGTYACDATYDAASVLASAARLKQMNEQSQQYYSRVNELSKQMKDAMEEINSLEQQIKK
ncbi:MAG: hypothetical protein LAN84_12585 [Acidobacteriia bacterium]|nr:hypothetical protein [Terriglobia bacterium]